MENSIYKKYIEGLVRRKNWVLVLCILGTALFTFFAMNVKILNALGNMLPEKDPDLVRFLDFNETYGGDFILMVGLKADDVFSPKMLAINHKATTFLEGLSDLQSVTSLTNARTMEMQEDTLVFEKLIPTLPETATQASQVKTKVFNDALFEGYLYHPKKNVTAIYATFGGYTTLMEKKEARDRVIHQIKNYMRALRKEATFKYYFSGNAPLEYELDVSSQKTQIFSTFSISLMLALVLYLLFKHVRGVILVLGLIGLTVLWTTGFISMIGKNLNFVTTLLPSLILIVAVLDGIHIYAVFRKLPLDIDRKTRMAMTFKQTFVPCTLTTLTTAIGFGSLMISEMEVIRDFGLFAVFGIVIAFLLTMLLLPVVILMMKDPKPEKQEKRVSPLFAKMNQFFFHVYQRHTKVALVLCVMIFGAISWGCFSLVIEDKPVSHYDKSNTVRQGFDFFDENFVGSTTVDIVITGPEGFLKDPKFLKQVDDFQSAYDKVDTVDYPLSILNSLKRAYQELAGLSQPTLPDTSGMIAQLLLLLESEDGFERFVKNDLSELRINTRVPALGSRVGHEMLQNLYKTLDETVAPPLEGHAVGSNVVWMNMGDYISRSFIESFTLTAILITIVMIVLLRSVKWGLMSMIPNLLPIAATFGLMGWMGVPLNLVTLMIASIGIGVAVDDTIHMITHIRRALENGSDLDDALQITFDKVGIPVITTSFVLTFGFLTLLFSDFKPAQYFGFFTAFTVFAALLCDLVLLPILSRMMLAVEKK